MVTSVMEPPKGMVTEGGYCGGVRVGFRRGCWSVPGDEWEVVGFLRQLGTTMVVAKNKAGVHVPHDLYRFMSQEPTKHQPTQTIRHH